MIKGDRCGQLGCRQPEVGGDVEDPLELQTKITICRLAGVLDRLQERFGRQLIADRYVWRHCQLDIADVLGRHVGCDPVGDQVDIFGSLDQIDDREIVPDEVREVLEV